MLMHTIWGVEARIRCDAEQATIQLYEFFQKSKVLSLLNLMKFDFSFPNVAGRESQIRYCLFKPPSGSLRQRIGCNHTP